MVNRNYLRGRAHEYAIKRKWEKEGWTVLRTAGSHGEFDLIAIKTADRNTIAEVLSVSSFLDGLSQGHIVLIQAKSGKSASREKAKLEPLRQKYDGIYSVRVALL